MRREDVVRPTAFSLRRGSHYSGSVVESEGIEVGERIGMGARGCERIEGS